MNGVRSISMRKGYLLTALAAAVLLAASSGTALAQQLEDVTITLEPPRSMPEGGDATITVRGKANVLMTPENDGDVASNRTVTVDVTLVAGTALGSATPAEVNAAGQVNDAGIVSNPRVTLTFAENTGSTTRSRTATGSITVRANDDADAESERVMVMGDANGGGNANVTDPTPVQFTIADDETQTYVLVLDPVTHTSIKPPMEGDDIVVNLEAKPRHYQGGTTLTLQLAANGGRATGYSAMGEGSSAGSVAIGTDNPAGGTALDAASVVNKRAITITQTHGDDGDGNRVTDMLALEAYSGQAGRDSLSAMIELDVLDIHMLPGPGAITAVAKDKDGKAVTEMMEGGDPVFLTITVDRGRGSSDRITDEELTVDLRAAYPAQVSDYELSESRIMFEGRSGGKQTNDVDLKIMLSARSDEDVGMEDLMLSLELSGDSDIGSETSSGTFSIGIVDNTMKKVAPKSEADAYPAILDALKAGSGDDGDFNPGESFSVMAEDLFDVADGYTASYGISVDGGSVSVSASSDSITVTGTAAGESKVTITATAKMAASSFLPEQTMSDVAKITFAVMVVEGMPEPVPALPLFGQLLLALFMTAGGARLYRRRQG